MGRTAPGLDRRQHARTGRAAGPRRPCAGSLAVPRRPSDHRPPPSGTFPSGRRALPQPRLFHRGAQSGRGSGSEQPVFRARYDRRAPALLCGERRRLRRRLARPSGRTQRARGGSARGAGAHRSAYLQLQRGHGEPRRLRRRAPCPGTESRRCGQRASRRSSLAPADGSIGATRFRARARCRGPDHGRCRSILEDQSRCPSASGGTRINRPSPNALDRSRARPPRAG